MLKLKQLFGICVHVRNANNLINLVAGRYANAHYQYLKLKRNNYAIQDPGVCFDFLLTGPALEKYVQLLAKCEDKPIH